MFIYFPPSLKVTPYLLVWVTLLGVTRAATSRDQFKEWYPQYGWIFTTITHGNCSREYNRSLTGKKNHSEIDYLSGGGIFTVLTQPLLDCILNHTSESLKSSMTSAQVLLGIMPTILAFLGPSHEELAMLANVGRRPLLAAGIALASPSAYFSRAFEYLDVKKILSRSRDRRPQWRPGKWQSKLGVVIVEYLVTTAACFNAINNTLQV